MLEHRCRLQDAAALKMKFHVCAQLQRSGIVALSGSEGDAAAAAFRTQVDRPLDGGLVIVYAVGK